jgi:hypothetical protein
MKQSMRLLTQSDSPHWCTPKTYIDMASRVMTYIDLDPASNMIANSYFVRACRIFSEGGLEEDWFATTLWLNPPYGKIGNQSSAGVWMNKLLQEYNAGHFKEAIALTKTVPGYDWWDDLFHDLWPGRICITRGRLSFVHASWVQPDGTIIVPDDVSNKSKSASSFWYIGNNENIFANVFSEIGKVL